MQAGSCSHTFSVTLIIRSWRVALSCAQLQDPFLHCTDCTCTCCSQSPACLKRVIRGGARRSSGPSPGKVHQLRTETCNWKHHDVHLDHLNTEDHLHTALPAHPPLPHTPRPHRLSYLITDLEQRQRRNPLCRRSSMWAPGPFTQGLADFYSIGSTC